MYGTLTTFDTLASSQQTIAQIGEDQAYQAIEARLVAHNGIMQDMLGELCETSTDRQRRYGGGGGMVMEDVDQMGRPQAQKTITGSIVAFPLRSTQAAVQWNRKYFMMVKAQEFAGQINDVLTADRLRVQRDMKRAMFTPTNSTFTDTLIDNVDLAVKALVNADSAPIPPGPNGEIFDASTHTHYLANATWTAAIINSLVQAVAEHLPSGQLRLYINRANEAAVRGLAGFYPYLSAKLVPGMTNDRAQDALGTAQNLNDRAIGLWNGGSGEAEVWVKPWVPANYAVVYNTGMRPLVYRTRENGSTDLTMVADDENYPLRARMWEREFGVAPWNRHSAAVLYVGGASYVTPVIT
jgi:hypothetical protein